MIYDNDLPIPSVMSPQVFEGVVWVKEIPRLWAPEWYKHIGEFLLTLYRNMDKCFLFEMHETVGNLPCLYGFRSTQNVGDTPFYGCMLW